MFVGFVTDGFDPDDRTPVSTGTTRDDAQALAIRRVLSLGITTGEITVVRQTQLTPAEFEKLRATLDAWFAEKGIQ